MGVVIDFHTHILPEVDDGSKSVEQSLEMLQQLKLQGVETVVLTPHFYPQSDRPESFLSRRQQAYEKLLEEVKGTEGLPQLRLGSEVYYFNGIGSWEGLKDLAIEGTDYVLVEMPFTKWSGRMYDELDGIYRNLGLVPVIAHIDRYINIFTANGVMKEIAELNAKVQANADFFINGKTRNLALKMLKNGDINILGSDCHNLADRKPNLAQAGEIICTRLGQQIAENINLTGKEMLSDYICNKL